MKSRYRLIALSIALFLPTLALAQQTITCASGPHGRRNYCSADTRGGVVIVQKRSPRDCVQGRQWGFDSDGIWVEGGCVADFEIRPYRGGAWWWDSGRGHRPRPWQGVGACFYTDPGYGGRYFCMGRGESVEQLPLGFNDQISSIQLVRADDVLIFSKDGFGGYSGRISTDVPRLKSWRIPGTNDSWNNRISSIRVE